MADETMFPDEAPTSLTLKQKKIIFGAVVALFATTGIFLFVSKPSSGEGPSGQTVPTGKPQATEAYEKAIPEKVERVTLEKDPGNSPFSTLLQQPEPPPPAIRPAVDLNEQQDPGYLPPPASMRTQYSAAPAEPYQYQVANAVAKRLDPKYQEMVRHFKGTKGLGWEMSKAELEELGSGSATALVDTSLRDLYANASATGMPYSLASGQRLVAVSDQQVSTDHPGFFTSTIARPHILQGAKLICQSGANVQDRVPIQPIKIVLQDGKEIPITGQVETNFPGLHGEVTSHWMGRMFPAVTNAAIGGAFTYWALSNSSSGDRIDTRDMIVAPIVQSSVEGVQNEITRLGGDRPNTVDVPAGQQFSVLLTEPITFKR